MYRKKSCPSDLSYELRLDEFGLLKASDFFDWLRLIFCFKLINGFGPSSFLQYFNQSKVNELRYLHSTSHTNAFFNSVFVAFPRLWNELPSSARSSTSLHSFKTSSREHFMNNQCQILFIYHLSLVYIIYLSRVYHFIKYVFIVYQLIIFRP